MLLTGHNHDFMEDPEFMAAYQRGKDGIGDVEYYMHWRIHVFLWAAKHCFRLGGDFVDCGCGRGFSATVSMKYLDWNSMKLRYFGFDTFSGIDVKYLNEIEANSYLMTRPMSRYPDSFEKVKENFSEFNRIHLIKGSIPETLRKGSCHVRIGKVCFLAIDMNCAVPEIAAAEYFWPKMVSGSMAVLDDYAYHGYQTQKDAFDAFALRKGISILSLPTGQGIYIKP